MNADNVTNQVEEAQKLIRNSIERNGLRTSSTGRWVDDLRLLLDHQERALFVRDVQVRNSTETYHEIKNLIEGTALGFGITTQYDGSIAQIFEQLIAEVVPKQHENATLETLLVHHTKTICELAAANGAMELALIQAASVIRDDNPSGYEITTMIREALALQEKATRQCLKPHSPT